MVQAGEVAQRLGALPALAEDLSSGLGTHMGQLSTVTPAPGNLTTLVSTGTSTHVYIHM